MKSKKINWESRGKTIKELIDELNTFEDSSMKVEISLDGGATAIPISLVGKKDGKCLIFSIKS